MPKQVGSSKLEQTGLVELLVLPMCHGMHDVQFLKDMIESYSFNATAEQVGSYMC